MTGDDETLRMFVGVDGSAGSDAMLGSVAHQVVTYSACPVVVVPTERDGHA